MFSHEYFKIFPLKKKNTAQSEGIYEEKSRFFEKLQQSHNSISLLMQKVEGKMMCF